MNEGLVSKEAKLQSFPFQMKQEANGFLQVEKIWARSARLSAK